MAKEWSVDNGYEIYSTARFIIEFGLKTPVDFGVGPDFIAKKNNEVFFIQFIVNQTGPRKLGRETLKIGEQYGLRTMLLKLDVRVGEVSLTEVLP